MYNDLADLREFYSSPLGQRAQRSITAALERLLPKLDQHVVLGLGYALPVLERMKGGSARLIAAMPPGQGATQWTATAGNAVVLAHEDELPLPDDSVDLVVLVHALECAAHTHALMRELWRVLEPQGRLLLVVPNRRGLWAGTDATPFGTGTPYSRSQVRALLRRHLFLPERTTTALFLPPVRRRTMLGFAGLLERLGLALCPAWGGVVCVEAVKQMHALPPPASEKILRRWLAPLTAPVEDGPPPAAAPA